MLCVTIAKIWHDFLQCCRIDATCDDGVGGLLNDDHLNPLLAVKVVVVDGLPYPAFFARHDINAGQELTYNYGGQHKSYWWRQV